MVVTGLPDGTGIAAANMRCISPTGTTLPIGILQPLARFAGAWQGLSWYPGTTEQGAYIQIRDIPDVSLPFGWGP